MVMKQNAMRRNLRQSIVKSFGRYFAITAIIALGSGLFLGLSMTKTDMVATGQKFITEQNMFDLRMVCNYGWSEEYVDEFAQLPGVESAEGQIYLDLIAKVEDKTEAAYRFYAIPEKVNQIALRGGRMPENDHECLADGYRNNESLLGTRVVISDANKEDSLDSVRCDTFTVVGLVSSPLYMDMNRGTTTIGSGALENYFYIPETAFDVDYYTEIDITLDRKYPIYSAEYTDYVDEMTDQLEPEAEKLRDRRFQDVKQEAEEEYNDGYQEYLDAVKEFEDGKAEAEKELADAFQELKDAEEELEDARVQMLNAGYSIDSGYDQLESSGYQYVMEDVYASTKSTLDASYEKLMINWGTWRESREEVKEGWVDYQEARKEVAQELADAEAELADAEEELKDAREEIDSMDEPDLYILDRESNVGYNNLDSSSDIVAGVSRVFPVFFLLIASLVCITTMTRMIDEERTQIGTLKALGYSSGEIVSKYLIYSGSGAVIGCILGVTLGCTVIPMIIWEAYKIMLYIQPAVILTVNWPLAIGISVAYLAVMLLVTWYCCDKTLREEPAQLIRPKAPEVGKQILLERLRIWKKLKFLNKVAIRNIFRYRQRLAMMLIGIGGCTALLIAGFGLRDSIVNIVDYQFRDVTHYDISVYFRDVPIETEQRKFEEAIQDTADDFTYYHQSSVELDTGAGVKELYMIAGDASLERFISLNRGGTGIALPGENEVVISVGAAEMMGIRKGDTVKVRSADMQEMELTVSGIYDNYIQNYCIVAPETIESQWGDLPEMQMAFVRMKDGVEVHSVSAVVSDLDMVQNVSVSEDLAVMVNGMMEALDLVVMVAVVSACLLAIIVLYNLTNININERIREIATIKVLGFNAGETASYVFKENMVLTVFGSILGLGLGRLLLEFIMAQVQIDMVWFRTVLTSRSCALAVVMTLMAAVAVEVIFYFRLEKINMAEALKSVE